MALVHQPIFRRLLEMGHQHLTSRSRLPNVGVRRLPNVGVRLLHELHFLLIREEGMYHVTPMRRSGAYAFVPFGQKRMCLSQISMHW